MFLRSVQSRLMVCSLAGLILISMILGASIPASAGGLKSFASCIGNSGATFYGAYWCPQCAKQNNLFGQYSYLLPYVECYEDGTKNRLQVCDGITGYPTWVFPDGSVRTGRLSLETLANATGCSLPSKGAKTIEVN